MVKGYADDLALVASDLEGAVAAVAPDFAAMEEVARLRVNFPKLGDAALEEVAARLGRRFAGWGSVACRDCARYLGFVVGPGGARRLWEAPLRKLADRAIHWGAGGLGLHFAAAAWNTYVVSLLGFLAQLAELLGSWAEMEGRAMRRLVPGPARWVLPADLHAFKR